ncbi:MAG: tetratricopeptide repeat protein, partial [Bacteroidales bacterium]|nr:tetratricopeptide repeat protein [Bacteroidales bacterium]
SYYEKTNRQYLEGDVLNEYYFRYGYSLYRTNDYPKALVMFSEIKDIDTEYTSPALYYYSQIAYENEMYNTALEGFQRLQNDETFGGIVPFYLVQIMYMNKDFDALIEMAPDLLESASDERSIELCSFIGDAYYNKGLYEEALPFLERYSQAKRLSDREDQYQLAYCYYKTGNYAKASEILLDISSKSDALSQNVWFVLGDCYLKQGDKQKAQFGFGQAAKLNFDKEIKEEALFNYAKLTYEVSSPFGEAMNAFQEYVDKYPTSAKIQEAYNYLISTYLASKNYKAAISSLEKIDNMDPKMEEAYQKVAYYRGLELFKNLEFSQAITMLNKSLEYGKYSDQYKALALYWRGEAYYRQGNYEKAKNDYSSFISTSGSNKTDVYALARYNLGSALFNMGNYSEALNQFKAFVTSSNIDPDVLADARNRIADCYYVATDYTDAIDYYDKVIAYDKVDADYAMYQKAFSLGLVNKQSEKAQVLSNLIQKYPSSSYVPNAYYERGRAYMTLEQYSRSESDFQKIISSYDNQYVPKAMVQLGLLYYNIGENQKAIDQYKKVVENYKSSEEARYALNGLKNVYVEMNDVESYFAFTKMIQGYVNDSAAEKDSLL